jgi:crossover junction endodeoxyribonuclease RuvC
MIYIGIDPGLSGAVAVIHPNNDISIYDTPTFTIKSGSKSKRKYNIAIMTQILVSHYSKETKIALELVHAMPGQGVTSMFTMGEGYGMWQGIIASLYLPLTFVTPQLWKKTLMDGMGKDKDASRMRAIQLFPQVADQLKLKKHDGRADALLIAEYLRRTNG